MDFLNILFFEYFHHLLIEFIDIINLLDLDPNQIMKIIPIELVKYFRKY